MDKNQNTIDTTLSARQILARHLEHLNALNSGRSEPRNLLGDDQVYSHWPSLGSDHEDLDLGQLVLLKQGWQVCIGLVKLGVTHPVRWMWDGRRSHREQAHDHEPVDDRGERPVMNAWLAGIISEAGGTLCYTGREHWQGAAQFIPLPRAFKRALPAWIRQEMGEVMANERRSRQREREKHAHRRNLVRRAVSEGVTDAREVIRYIDRHESRR